MPRRTSALGFLLLLACGGAAVPRRTAPSWADARRDARAALDSHDYPAYRRQLEALYARSHSPWVLLELARADALLGDRSTALERLGTFARAGLTYDAATDSKLASLRDDPAFASLCARLAANGRPVAHASEILRLPQDDLVTEDIARDSSTGTFFVSSVRRRKILAVGPDGRARDLTAADPGVASILGLAFSRGHLWATTAAMPPMVGYDAHALNPTALLAFDPSDGRLIERIDLHAGPGDHALTDLAVGRDGALFVSDSAGAAVYELAPGVHALAELAGSDELVSPQTPAPSADGNRLYVPDYVRGIARLDLTTRELTWLGHPDDVAVSGIDGLYLDGATFLAVQNGVQPPRIVRLVPSPDGTRIVRAEVIEQATPGLGEPTHGVVADGAFYFLANAGWNRFGDDGRLLASAPADAPAVWRLPL